MVKGLEDFSEATNFDSEMEPLCSEAVYLWKPDAGNQQGLPVISALDPMLLEGRVV